MDSILTLPSAGELWDIVPTILSDASRLFFMTVAFCTIVFIILGIYACVIRFRSNTLQAILMLPVFVLYGFLVSSCLTIAFATMIATIAAMASIDLQSWFIDIVISFTMAIVVLLVESRADISLS
ncbi:hypothetical protein J8273_7316 [Carpediemonas membranifera]|uniref:Uncharacterized protein n=1 Tax=Carpediemonas membranifera TaxID=201153 RepID=A0A8J6E1T3_9EUKA|nr:hypothetical protein J8273_7316 [Carpediemonas membranifera]|eukprot:KAG9391042.1 hypothetical protein J8273_7316 [Carpediemonas membranifera]